MPERPLKVAWISYFPVEWLPDAPEPVRALPRLHPATWQRVLANEFKRFAGLKLDIIAVRKQFERSCSFQQDGVTFHCLKAPGGWRRPSLFWVDTVLIRRCLRQIQPDVVHAWGTEDGAALVASRLGYPFLVTIQGLLQWYEQETKLPLAVRLAVPLERIGLRRARVVTAESNFPVNFIRQRYPRLEVRHVDVVPDELFHRVQRQPETQPIRILFVGAVELRKGGDLFVRSLDKLETDYRAVVVGGAEKELERQLRREATERVWSRLEFKQQLLPEGVAQELAQATFIVCPTRADTGPMVVKEAALAGVPVVGSAVGGIPDYIVPGKNGLLFPSGNLEACLSAIRQTIAHPLFGRGKVDEVTLGAVRERLAPRRMADGFFEAYQRVVAAWQNLRTGCR